MTGPMRLELSPEEILSFIKDKKCSYSAEGDGGYIMIMNETPLYFTEKQFNNFINNKGDE